MATLYCLASFRSKPRLIDCLRQGFLAIDVLAHADGGGGSDGVRMIGRGHNDRIQRLLLLEHLAEVLVKLRVGILLARREAAVLSSTSHRATMFSPEQQSVSLAPLPPVPITPMFSFSFAEMGRGRGVVQPVKAVAPAARAE